MLLNFFDSARFASFIELFFKKVLFFFSRHSRILDLNLKILTPIKYAGKTPTSEKH